MNRDPNFVNKRGETPLFKAKTAREVELLVERGADVNAIRQGGFVEGFGTTPLFRATTLEVQAALIAAGANPNAFDESGRTPLFSVPAEPAFTENLIRAGADVNRADGDGNTPLHYAVSGDYPDIVDLLLTAGADINAKNHQGKLALFYASVATIADQLLRAGADVHAQDKEGRTALFLRDHEVILTDDDEAVARALLVHGADPFVVDIEGNMPIVQAAVVARAAHRRTQLLAIAGEPNVDRLSTRAM